MKLLDSVHDPRGYGVEVACALADFGRAGLGGCHPFAGRGMLTAQRLGGVATAMPESGMKAGTK